MFKKLSNNSGNCALLETPRDRCADPGKQRETCCASEDWIAACCIRSVSASFSRSSAKDFATRTCPEKTQFLTCTRAQTMCTLNEENNCYTRLQLEKYSCFDRYQRHSLLNIGEDDFPQLRLLLLQLRILWCRNCSALVQASNEESGRAHKPSLACVRSLIRNVLNNYNCASCTSTHLKAKTK